MSKISMVEYQGRCDVKGKAIGHAPKVLKEYYNFISKDNEVKVYAPQVIIDSFEGDAGGSAKPVISSLSEHIVMTSGKSFFKRLKEKAGMFKNIKAALKNNDSDYIWFFNVEYYLMLYIFLHKKSKNKIICTFFLDGYHNGFVGKVKQWVFEKAQKKIDLIIATGPNLKFKNCKTLYIPDYYYIPEKYDQVRSKAKEDKAVCLGTMNNGKKLEDMVEAFNSTGYPLYIAGRFFDKDRFMRLTEMAEDNIKIEDKYLSDEEYLDILSSARFTVLPYNPSQYNRQTSGVMQEAVFTDSIVVTFKDILDGNSVPGLGFSSWDQLTGDMLREFPSEKVYAEYEDLRKNVFSREKVEESYSKVFNN